MSRPLIRFFLLVLILGVAMPVAVMLFVEPIDGDLTRIGFLPERAFGWNAVQPQLTGKLGNATAAEATVIVLGDSFSRRGVWQEIALDQRAKYITYDDQRICPDVAAVFRNQGLMPKVAVIETVERTFSWRFFEKCETSKLRSPAFGEASPTSSTRYRGILDGSFGFRYSIGSLLYYLRRGEQHRPGDFGGVSVKSVANGCALFSNLECTYGLFLGDDDTQPSFPLEQYESIVFDYLRSAGVTRILVVAIPNKTSVYTQTPERASLKDAYMAEFGARNGIEVVLLNQPFAEARSERKDLYLPNNTHLSPYGEWVLGKLVKDRLGAEVENRDAK